MEIGQKVKIISDSTCDLSQELTAKYDIDILPLHILLGENEFRDGKDTTPDRIFAWADANKATPKTSAPSLEDAKVLLQPYVAAGREVICFSISGSMSTSGNVMRLAAEELDAAAQVTIIDSENLSTGIGLLVLEAAIMAEQGHTAASAAARSVPWPGQASACLPGRPAAPTRPCWPCWPGSWYTTQRLPKGIAEGTIKASLIKGK